MKAKWFEIRRADFCPVLPTFLTAPRENLTRDGPPDIGDDCARPEFGGRWISSFLPPPEADSVARATRRTTFTMKPQSRPGGASLMNSVNIMSSRFVVASRSPISPLMRLKSSRVAVWVLPVAGRQWFPFMCDRTPRHGFGLCGEVHV